MKINKLQDINLDLDGTILTAAFNGADKLIMLLSSGDVIRYSIKTKNVTVLFSTNDFHYAIDGFDINAHSRIYALDDIVVIVNDYKRHGFIHFSEKKKTILLFREDYHADISIFPISLYKDAFGDPHLIFSVNWNHLHIMNLKTLEVLTKKKSLRRADASENDTRSYDYFFGKLYLSPDQKKFLSAGWIWGSSDFYNIYDIDQFIHSDRIAESPLGCWEHTTRPVSWIENDQLVVSSNPCQEGDDGATEESPIELLFYKAINDKFELVRRVQIPGLKVMYDEHLYSKVLNCLIAFSDSLGAALIDLNGQFIFRNENIKIKDVDVTNNLLLSTEAKTLTIYQIV